MAIHVQHVSRNCASVETVAAWDSKDRLKYLRILFVRSMNSSQNSQKYRDCRNNQLYGIYIHDVVFVVLRDSIVLNIHSGIALQLVESLYNVFAIGINNFTARLECSLSKECWYTLYSMPYFA